MTDDRRELEFLRTLGVGGFGSVYLANLHGRDRFVRRVAVKVMREGLDATPDLVARQKDEARLLGLLAHDGIVQVLDLAEVQGRPAVVMEYVEGVDLAEVIKATSPRRFPVRAALEIVGSVAAALDAAFNSVSALTEQPLRVIHRDIKPANILLTPSGRVKVLDFGVAKADFARDGHTTNVGWGTPRFMAPEQWLGEPYGAPIDTYALGVTLFDLVADRPWERPPLSRTPFEAHVAAQLDAQQDLPEAVLELVAAMTAFDPADRPTAAQVREFAESACADAPGESLTRYARANVPALVDARSRSAANQPVPEPVTLGSVSREAVRTPGAPGPRPDEPSIVATPTASSLPGTAGVRPAIWGALVLGVAGAGMLALVLGGLAWHFASPDAPFADAPFADPALAAATGAEAAPAALAATTTPPDAAGSTGAPDATMAAGATPPATPAAADSPLVGAGTGAVPAPADPASAAATPRGRSRDVSPPRTTAAVGASGTARSSPAPATPAAPAATAAEPPAATRYPVSVTSVPASAEVWIDDVRIGETPLVGRSLPAGTHTAWLVLEGAKSPTTTLVVGPGATPNVHFTFSDQKWRSRK